MANPNFPSPSSSSGMPIQQNIQQSPPPSFARSVSITLGKMYSDAKRDPASKDPHFLVASGTAQQVLEESNLAQIPTPSGSQIHAMPLTTQTESELPVSLISSATEQIFEGGSSPSSSTGPVTPLVASPSPEYFSQMELNVQEEHFRSLESPQSIFESSVEYRNLIELFEPLSKKKQEGENVQQNQENNPMARPYIPFHLETMQHFLEKFRGSVNGLLNNIEQHYLSLSPEQKQEVMKYLENNDFINNLKLIVQGREVSLLEIYTELKMLYEQSSLNDIQNKYADETVETKEQLFLNRSSKIRSAEPSKIVEFWSKEIQDSKERTITNIEFLRLSLNTCPPDSKLIVTEPPNQTVQVMPGQYHPGEAANLRNYFNKLKVEAVVAFGEFEVLAQGLDALIPQLEAHLNERMRAVSSPSKPRISKLTRFTSSILARPGSSIETPDLPLRLASQISVRTSPEQIISSGNYYASQISKKLEDVSRLNNEITNLTGILENDRIEEMKIDLEHKLSDLKQLSDDFDIVMHVAKQKKLSGTQTEILGLLYDSCKIQGMDYQQGIQIVEGRIQLVNKEEKCGDQELIEHLKKNKALIAKLNTEQLGIFSRLNEGLKNCKAQSRGIDNAQKEYFDLIEKNYGGDLIQGRATQIRGNVLYEYAKFINSYTRRSNELLKLLSEFPNAVNDCKENLKIYRRFSLNIIKHKKEIRVDFDIFSRELTKALRLSESNKGIRPLLMLVNDQIKNDRLATLIVGLKTFIDPEKKISFEERNNALNQIFSEISTIIKDNKDQIIGVPLQEPSSSTSTSLEASG